MASSLVFICGFKGSLCGFEKEMLRFTEESGGRYWAFFLSSVQNHHKSSNSRRPQINIAIEARTCQVRLSVCAHARDVIAVTRHPLTFDVVKLKTTPRFHTRDTLILYYVQQKTRKLLALSMRTILWQAFQQNYNYEFRYDWRLRLVRNVLKMCQSRGLHVLQFTTLFMYCQSSPTHLPVLITRGSYIISRRFMTLGS